MLNTSSKNDETTSNHAHILELFTFTGDQNHMDRPDGMKT